MFADLKLKFGFKALLRNPWRAAVSFLLAVAAFGITGMCIFGSTYSVYEWEKECYFLDQGKYTVFYLSDRASYSTTLSIKGSSCFKKDTYEKMKEDIQEIGGGFAAMYGSPNFSTNFRGGRFSLYKLYRFVGRQDGSLYGERDGEQIIAPTGNSSEIFDCFYSWMTVYSGAEAIDEFGYTLYGKLPEKADEIAIPQWFYNSLLCYGYRDPATEEITEINCEADVIGKTLELARDIDSIEEAMDIGRTVFSAKIVGIIHADYGAEAFEESFEYRTLSEPDYVSLIQVGAIDQAAPPHVGFAVSNEYLEMHTRSQNPTSDEAYVDYMVVLHHHPEYAEEYFSYITAWKKGGVMEVLKGKANGIDYSVGKDLSGMYMAADSVLEDESIFFTVKPLVPFFIVFASALLAYLCVSTVAGRLRGAGILQSLGAKPKDIFIAFGIPLMLFALLCSFGALGVELCFLKSMNRTLVVMTNYMARKGTMIPFRITWQTWLFTFLTPAAVVAVSLGALFIFFRKKPVISKLAKNPFRLFGRRLK